MKLSSLKMLLFFLGYIMCFSDMTSLTNPFEDVESLHNFNDFEIKKQLKIVNKPATKIIKTIDGDLYGCVNFYNQPAFDHPSMKNQLFHDEMRRMLSLQHSRANNNKFGYLWENGIGCPNGTVPIKRVTKDELLRLNLFPDKYKPQGSWNFTYNQYNIDDNQHHFAVSRTKKGKGKEIYNGATMMLSINDPKVKPPQFSSARMHVQIGDDFIQAGWTINPNLYSDSKPRSFVYTKVGEKQCYNSMCPTIIMVRSDIALGVDLGPPCVRGSKTGVYSEFGVLKDKQTGKWWLKILGEEIGFWPAERFLQSSSNNIEWGGEVYSASMPSPEMGYGHFPQAHIEYDAIIFNITIVDENFKIVERVKNRESFSDNNHGYQVVVGIDTELSMRDIIFYGGPGNI